MLERERREHTSSWTASGIFRKLLAQLGGGGELEEPRGSGNTARQGSRSGDSGVPTPDGCKK